VAAPETASPPAPSLPQSNQAVVPPAHLQIEVLRRPVESTQYTSEQFAVKAREFGVRRSMGRTGVCFDNAMAESFNAALKTERVHRTVYPTREHARTDIARYIEFRYNRRRLHSGLGYKTPYEARQEFWNRQSAA
jgi:putative transposase